MKVLMDRLFEQDNIFKPASKSDIETRKQEKIQIWIEDFEQRSDVKKNKDESYDVDGDVDLSGMKLTKLPVKFGTVTEFFYCSHNQLTSLEGSPRTVGEDFWCSNNQLTSLKGSPRTIGKSFYCSYNQLTSLEGSPETVGGYFNCSYNQLTSLEGSPETVDGDFDCSRNKKKFTVDEVRKVCDVKGKIYV